jgi:hypothetical protein
MFTVSALRPIEEGEEITIDYVGELEGVAQDQRKTLLPLYLDFQCNCEACK